MAQGMDSYSSVLAPGLFSGQTILITGGGSGIGRCIAHELASLGAMVVLMGRTLEKLQTVAAEIVDDGGVADWVVGDIRDDVQVAGAVAQVVEKHGRIHGLVNNAGGQFPSPLQDISKNGFEAVIRLNLVGGFLMSREVFNQSMHQHGGAIVNITADCANGYPTMAHTGAARAGTENLSKTAAWEWGPYGVRMNSVAPGYIASSGLDTYTDPLARETIRNAPNAIPLKRMATEAEVSAVVCFLLSPGAGFINGDTIHIDGGAQFGSSQIHSPQPAEAVNQSTAFNGFHRAVTPKLLSE